MTVPWVAVVPVKPLATAKSRLDSMSSARRQALAGAFAVDTVAAVRAVADVRAVVVVCSDEAVAVELAAPGVEVLPEPSRGMDSMDTGLNAAARAGIHWALNHHPGAGIVIVPADLPALRPVDVVGVLRLASKRARTALADREGTGTTMLTGLPGTPPRPRFGADSLARHLADGAVALDPAGLDRASRDVDTVGHLLEACRLGVGPATGRVLDAQ